LFGKFLKMILIFSKSELEPSTNMVIDWLEYYKADYLRINGNEIFERYTYQLEDTWKVIDSTSIKVIPEPDLVKVVWNRRWLDQSYLRLQSSKFKDSRLANQYNQFVTSEYWSLRKFFSYYYRKSFWIDPESAIQVNKLMVLEKAKEYGLAVPLTLVTGTKNELGHFMRKFGPIIVKSISEMSAFTINGKGYNMFTSIVDNNFMELPEFFFPSCFQTCVNKEYEIRTFYFFGKCYSMALFSQMHEASSIDFRADYKEDNFKEAPYKLPLEIEKAINRLMDNLGLNTGSLDLIYTPSGEYVFLEVNPIGQFGMVSLPCNYGLEKIIAEKLIELDKVNDEK